MTREQAIAKVKAVYDAPLDHRLTLGQNGAAGEVDVLVALGLLRLEEPAPAVTIETTSGGFSTIREATLVRVLRQAGYEVSKAE